MTGMKEDLNLLSDQSNSLPVALHPRIRVLQRIRNLKHHYAGVLIHRVPSKLRKSFHGTTLIVSVFIGIVTKIRLVWHSFIASTDGEEHQERITNFYKEQAVVYDETRKDLLKGRRTMLRLSAAQLLESCRLNRGKRLVWVDIGGGTGYNIEAMDAFLRVNTFDAIYLVDICAPLLDVAKKRFAALGWTNVHVIHQDAASFVLPEASWISETFGQGSVSLVTFSYSLSMIPDFYSVLDRISCLVSPDGGIVSVVDFYTSGTIFQWQPSAADINRTCSRPSRWFWQIWFDFDNVMLGPQRREYLEHRFETLKVYNGRNGFLLPSLICIPYYIWLGQPRRCVTSIKGGLASLSISHQTAFESLFRNAPWRIPYLPKPCHGQMTTFMYSFTWEDPFEDMKYLEPGASDSLLVITSAGDNALHYALESGFKTIHCVDMNPCQGHLLELKIAALRVLSYEDVYKMFGQGHIESFREILDSKMSPLLSAPCYQFWKTNTDMFASSLPLYMHGFSGYALRIVRALFKITGRCHDVERMCNARSIAEQNHIWHHRIRPVILNPLVVWLLNNRWFCWRALGVPKNQRKILLTEGTAYDYIRDTLDPVVGSKLLKDEAYHYLMTLLGHYTSTSCPLYLTRGAFDALKANDGELLSPIKIHTDTITGALKTMPASSLGRAILMDHLDWFSENDVEADEELEALHRVLKPGGFILLRSAARTPWYIERFKSIGFEVLCLNVRKPGCKEALDCVNMYASFWKISKPDIRV